MPDFPPPTGDHAYKNKGNVQCIRLNSIRDFNSSIIPKLVERFDIDLNVFDIDMKLNFS
jgi:hypothetical protein